jgi:hypothetical protein
LISGARGNDYDLASLKLTRWFGRQMAASIKGSLSRTGEGSVTSDWNEPWMQVEGDYSEPFPTGIVEKISSVSLSLKGYFRTLAAFDIEAGLDRIDNFAHQTGDNRSLPFVRLSLSALFSTIINAE